MLILCSPYASARVRYEDIVGDTVAELERIFQALDAPPLLTPAQAVEAVSFERLQKEAPNHHFWQGRAGLWRELLPTASAIAIAEAHDAHRREFGYEVVVDEATARARWQALAVTHELAAAS